MKLFIKINLLLVFSLLIIACNPEPDPISYGNDACHNCKMNIVDQQHAAEIVTDKGKAYKYDSIECMMRDIKNRTNNEIALYLITDYSNPGKFVDATLATFLISDKLPSPMGANLNGFELKSKAKITQKENLGNLYSWNELKELF